MLLETVVTVGLTERVKLSSRRMTLVIPETSTSGVNIVAIGNGVNNALASNDRILEHLICRCG